MDNQENLWYVVRTKSNAEKKVDERLKALSLESFLPLYETLRMWSDRKKKVKVPLIPSHLFVRCETKQLHAIYSVDGVASILKEKGQPAIVRAHEIENLRILTTIQEPPALVPTQRWSVGTAVCVTEGPLTGLVGIVAKTSSGRKIHIEFKQLGLKAVLPYTHMEKKELPK